VWLRRMSGFTISSGVSDLRRSDQSWSSNLKTAGAMGLTIPGDYLTTRRGGDRITRARTSGLPATKVKVSNRRPEWGVVAIVPLSSC